MHMPMTKWLGMSCHLLLLLREVQWIHQVFGSVSVFTIEGKISGSSMSYYRDAWLATFVIAVGFIASFSPRTTTTNVAE